MVCPTKTDLSTGLKAAWLRCQQLSFGQNMTGCLVPVTGNGQASSGADIGAQWRKNGEGEMMGHKEAIAELERKAEEAWAAVVLAQKQTDARQAEYGEAVGRLRDARIAADADLPRAIVKTRNGEHEVVIDRRTASTIYTRSAGEPSDRAQAWRQSSWEKRAGPTEWSRFPQPKTRLLSYDAHTLIIKEPT